MNKNLRNQLALEQLKNYGIDIPKKYQKYIIAYPYQDDIFPIFLGDDGGYDYFECELPICRNGDLIKVGVRYDTQDFDNCSVVGMKLNGYFKTRWIITIDDREFGEQELMVYE
ncbi:MAG: hypothetical protein ACKN9K_30050, partial [Dolichospermum sp.]